MHEPLSPVVNFHHSTAHEVVAVSNICWKSEWPKPGFKFVSHWLLSQLLPSLDLFPRFRFRIFKTQPTFLSCRLWFYRPDPADLPLEPVQDCGIGLHKIFPIFSISSPCLQCQTGMAAAVSQLLTDCQSSVAQVMVQSPLMLVHMDWMCLWAPVSGLLGWGDRSIGKWLNSEPCFITFLCTGQSQNKIPNN